MEEVEGEGVWVAFSAVHVPLSLPFVASVKASWLLKIPPVHLSTACTGYTALRHEILTFDWG